MSQHICFACVAVLVSSSHICSHSSAVSNDVWEGTDQCIQTFVWPVHTFDQCIQTYKPLFVLHNYSWRGFFKIIWSNFCRMTASLELIVAVVPDTSLSTLRGKQTLALLILLIVYPSAYGLILMNYICLCKYLMELLVLAYGYCWFIIRLETPQLYVLQSGEQWKKSWQLPCLIAGQQYVSRGKYYVLCCQWSGLFWNIAAGTWKWASNQIFAFYF